VSVLVGLDVGTSGARTVAVDGEGNVVAEASAEYPLYSPRPGWTEQNSEDWWRGAREALGRVAAEVEGEVVGLGLMGQMQGSVFLDPSDEVCTCRLAPRRARASKRGLRLPCDLHRCPGRRQ
jgi:xylulokinase